MAIDTYLVHAGVYRDRAAADTDYEAVKAVHERAGVLDSYDAAVLVRRDDGKVVIVRKHETPTRAGGVLGAGFGLATGLVVALFPSAAIGGGLLAAATAGGAALGAVSGHAASGMSRQDLAELGDHLDAGQAGLVVVGAAELAGEVEAAMAGADEVHRRELHADHDAIEADARTDG